LLYVRRQVSSLTVYCPTHTHIVRGSVEHYTTSSDGTSDVRWYSVCTV